MLTRASSTCRIFLTCPLTRVAWTQTLISEQLKNILDDMTKLLCVIWTWSQIESIERQRSKQKAHELEEQERLYADSTIYIYTIWYGYVYRKHVCVCVYVCMCTCVCACVCACERERANARTRKRDKSHTNVMHGFIHVCTHVQTLTNA